MANTVTPHEVRVINGRKGGQRTNSYESLATRLINGLKSDELSEQQRKSIAGAGAALPSTSTEPRPRAN